jgi:hypothetical protein
MQLREMACAAIVLGSRTMNWQCLLVLVLVLVILSVEVACGINYFVEN